MHCLHATFRIMAVGNIPSSIASWIASASLAALKEEDGSHWPVAAGETLRRLAGKVLLATVSEDVTRYLQRNWSSEPRAAAKPSSTSDVGFRNNDNDDKRCLLNRGLGERLQPNRQVLFSSGNPTNGARCSRTVPCGVLCGPKLILTSFSRAEKSNSNNVNN